MASTDSASSDQSSDSSINFSDLNLSEAVMQALAEVGYESPSPIQAQTIPHILAGTDVLGQAQTGTGKTAAFALPILSRLDLRAKSPQALVLVPTRELAIQVAEAFQKYASHISGFHVLPIYGGQSYTPQLTSLKRGVHVVVGTPGRIMDHLKRQTLDLSKLKHLVLDEADEMLHMGFIDDVEWILEQTPADRQVALFSATMPAQIRRICQKHLKSPAEITIRSSTTTATNIRQRYWIVGGMHNKLEALTRILEAETFDAMLVFARTKQATVELAEKLGARGFSVEALNGDIAQNIRERTIARLKSRQIDILVATDVAARGLDVERISHVINYDVPYDTESYVHRIGRTGRAGRSGEAILFVAPRERNMLRAIERATRQPIEPMQMPTVDAVNQQRISKFKDRIAEAITSGEANRFRFLVEQFEQENGASTIDIAAALVSLAQGRSPLLLESGRTGSGNDTAWAPTPSPSRERAPAIARQAAQSAHRPTDGQRDNAPRGDRRDERTERAPRPAKFSAETSDEQTARRDARDTAPARFEKPKDRAPARAQDRTPEQTQERTQERNSERTPSRSDFASKPQTEAPAGKRRDTHDSDQGNADRNEEMESNHESNQLPSFFEDAPAANTGSDDRDEIKRETFRIEVGHVHGVKP
ncbi:MAG TPA: DEAD/DEAH box helicase, partial [Steroidobacteraceae bacterium]|nr:DEAD/DEAH box helicase [Steroidobacteraceae bacterium]